MEKCPKHVVHYMHAYLDGEISREEEQILNDHLAVCQECREMMDGLQASVAFLSSAAPVQAPPGFVSGVVSRLPQTNIKKGPQRWLRKHPLLAAAALFLVLMSASLFSSYGNDQQFSFTKQSNLVVEGETVVVPEGEIVQGDIVVKNGDLRVEGEVDGNVTVIRGTKYMASTAVITGDSEEINEIFDWLWYKIKSTLKEVVPSSDQKEEPKE